MRKVLLILAGALLAAAGLKAQTTEHVDSLEYVDSLVYRQLPRVNEELEGMTIYQALGDVCVEENYKVRQAVSRQVEANKGPEGEVDGYRIRIYFDNKQKSREESQEVMARFKALHPGYNVYLKFNNPNFKVTVGDFRTKVDAQIALKEIIKAFPSAFIVKEKMRFPLVSDKVRYVIDTVKVPVRVPEQEIVAAQ
ncbi:MAG: SPOR domain-containing protein [Bacteroidales bacterium]|nr:SPOR domain-containing protein [Bacteroidales bacterium]